MTRWGEPAKPSRLRELVEYLVYIAICAGLFIAITAR